MSPQDEAPAPDPEQQDEANDGGLTRAADSSPVSVRGVLLAVGALVLAAAVFFAGWWVGRPTYPGDRSIDAGFSRDMQTHHGQAVDMSLIVRSAGARSGVMTLAYDIATTQENQRGEMRGWLETWGLTQARAEEPMAWMTRTGHAHTSGGPMLLPDGRMRGMASAAQLQRLRGLKGKDAEILYLQLMIPHHRAGVEMAQACVSACSEPHVVGLAQKMVNGQQSEIGLMTRMLRDRGATVPKGIPTS